MKNRRFTPSVDGINRCVLHVRAKASTELVTQVHNAAEFEGQSMADWLRNALRVGIQAELARVEEDCSARWETAEKPKCRECGCTDDDCSQCIDATGEPCYWIAPDLCSRCGGVS